MKKKFVFWGATGQAKVLREALEGLGHDLLILVDKRKIISPFVDITLLHGIREFDVWLGEFGNSPLYGMAAVGGSHGKERLKIMKLFEQRGILNDIIVHRTAFVASDTVIGAGSQILALSAICTHTKIGRGVIVNTSACVDHDCRISDGVHIAPGVKIAGEVYIGEYSFIGTGAIILPHIKIGKNTIVGAGSVVTKDIPSDIVVVGNPAKYFKKNIECE